MQRSWKHSYLVVACAFVFAFPVFSYAAEGTFLSSVWCSVTGFFGHPCAQEYSVTPVVEVNLPRPLPPEEPPAPVVVPTTAPATPYSVTENTYVTNPTTVIRETVYVPQEPIDRNDTSDSDGVSYSLFERQIDRIYDKIADIARDVSESVADRFERIADTFTTGALTVTGNTRLLGGLADSTDSFGTAGMLLQTTGTGTQWVATSTLGFGAGGVTSVGLSAPTGLVVSGSPVTSSGTLTLALDTGYVIPEQTLLDTFLVSADLSPYAFTTDLAPFVSTSTLATELSSYYLSSNPSGYLVDITGLVSAGTNVSLSGTGTSGDPYIIDAAGAPGGADTQLQFNSAGVFGGISELTWASSVLGLATNDTATTPRLQITNAGTGDASMLFGVTGGSYSIGVDNSDSDAFALSYGNASTNAVAGTNNILSVVGSATDAARRLYLGGTGSASNFTMYGGTGWGDTSISGGVLSQNFRPRIVMNGSGGGTMTANTNALSVLVGQSTLTEASSGTHDIFANLAVRPLNITNGTAVTTNAATVYIEGPAAGTATVTNNYSLWVDDGMTRLDGGLTLGVGSDATGDIYYRSSGGSLARLGVGTAGQVLTVSGSSLPSWVDGPAAQAGVDWTSRTSAADNSWNSVTYGNGLFVAVSSTGTGNRVMTSPDGINWTSRTSAADNAWISVTYGNGLFVAVSNDGTGNQVMTSPDGINWTSRTSAADNAWISVTYGNGLFVAVSQSFTGTINDRVMTSPDGITWTARTAAANYLWASVTYGNGLFVAVARSGTGNRVMTSPDGINWTSRAAAVNNSWRVVTYGNGLFVAVSYSGTGNRAMTSGKTQASVLAHNNIYQGGMTINGPVTLGSLVGGGTVEADANGVLSVASDESLKDISGPFVRGLSDLFGVSPIMYHWKEETGKDTERAYAGFSAQNIQLSIPEAVGETPQGTLTLFDRPILAAAVNAIKELYAMITGFAERFTTKMLCVEDLCVTRTEFEAILRSSGVEAHVPVEPDEIESEDDAETDTDGDETTDDDSHEDDEEESEVPPGDDTDDEADDDTNEEGSGDDEPTSPGDDEETVDDEGDTADTTPPADDDETSVDDADETDDEDPEPLDDETSSPDAPEVE